MDQNNLEKLKEELNEIYHLSSAISVLHWDQDVYMPKRGGEMRAKTIANLSGLVHARFTSKLFGSLIKKAVSDMKKGELPEKDARIVREIWREYSREKKLPAKFVKELAETESRSQEIWREARAKSDFKMFRPWLSKIVALKRKEAEYVGFKKTPYDALLDEFEPEMTAEEVSIIFHELKEFLIPFLKEIKKSKVKIDKKALKGNFPLEKQVKFNKFTAEKLGFDFEAGMLETSTHPFTTNFHPHDVRMTTRYKKDDVFNSINSTMHETGHALYEQGLPAENFGTPLGESISLGIHESQSRMWENIIGKSESFWKHFFPLLKKEFPGQFKGVDVRKFYEAINAVKPSLVRVEADEVTYNLHIILRFEIEKELVEGSIEVKDLPKIWNAKVKEYFGLKVPNDAAGILQDVHWSMGAIGYFPTYTLGNLYSAQFYDAARKKISNLEKEITKGDFGNLLKWLRKNIHQHGKFYTAGELAEKVTGEKLNSRHYIDYIKDKYSKIYKINQI